MPLTLVLALVSPVVAEAGGCNEAPIAVNDTAGHLGAPLTVDVLANDKEPNGEPLSLEIVSVSAACLPDNVIADHGHIRLTPFPLGTPKNCTVIYRIRDERGSTATGVLNLVAEGLLFMDGFETGNTSNWVVELL